MVVIEGEEKDKFPKSFLTTFIIEKIDKIVLPNGDTVLKIILDDIGDNNG